MSNKTSSGKTTLGLFAFIAVILNAIAWAISIIFNAFKINLTINGKSITGLLTGIASLLLLIVVLFVGWSYAKKCTKGWKTFYLVLAIISVLAVLFGVGVNFAI